MTVRTLQRCLPETAFAWIDRWSPLTATAALDSHAAVGQRLARAVLADSDEPSAALAALDGFAVLAAETEGASDYSPLPLTLARTGPLNPGAAMPVRSGEPLPVGADAVLSLELADVAG